MNSISWESTLVYARLGVTRAVALFIAMVMSAVGCSQSSHELAPVRGKVTMGNQPLTGGKVMFAPIANQDTMDAGKPAVGLIQTDGNFSLTTLEDGDGAIVGEHWVTVFVPAKPVAQSSVVTEASSEVTKFKRVAVPKKQLVVAGQDNQIDIQL